MQVISFCYKVMLIIWLSMYAATIVNAAENNANHIGLPPTEFGTILDWHCITEKNTCLAVGYEIINNEEVPLLLKSNNLSENWTKEAISALVTRGRLTKVACSWNGTFCIALGSNTASNKEPFLLQSTDNVTTWILKSLPIESYNTLDMTVAACTGQDQSSYCMIAGTFNNGVSSVMMQSRDFGKSWQAYDFLDSRKHSKINNRLQPISSASCAGNSDQVSCIIYGKANTNNQPDYYIFTNNRGQVWEFRNNPV